MNDKSPPPNILVTARQQAILKVLADAGVSEGGELADGRRYEDAPPQGLAMMIDFALDGAASEDDILGILTWGHRESFEGLRPVARSIMAIRDSDEPPA